MPHLFAYLDESGQANDSPIVAFSGFVDGFEHWLRLQEKWSHLLREYQIPSFRAVQALEHFKAYGTMKPGTPEERTNDLLPFIKVIVEVIELGFAVAVDSKAYKSADKKVHARFGRDPHYFAFYSAVGAILDHYDIPKHLTIGLICDDDERTAMHCYSLLKKFKREHPEIRARIPSICFGDDEDAEQIQAADLFAYITRLEAQKRFAGKDYFYSTLHRELQSAAPQTHHHLHFGGGFYGADDLARLAAGI